jgi:hypothetical protein
MQNCFCREITLLPYFPAKFSRKFTVSFYFPANDRKPTERLCFSTEIQWEKLVSLGIEPSILSIEL